MSAELSIAVAVEFSRVIVNLSAGEPVITCTGRGVGNVGCVAELTGAMGVPIAKRVQQQNII